MTLPAFPGWGGSLFVVLHEESVGMSGRQGCPRFSANPERPQPDLDLFPAFLVDIREIKEIRPGKTSRDFDRYQEDPAFRPDQSHCFVILYGMEFRLKTLSLQGGS